MRVLFVLLLTIVSCPAFTQERRIHWDRFDVKAHLDADGRLNVEERQQIVFTGDWNGGERTFNIRPRQELAFSGMSRIDAQSGAEIPMSRGSLDTVDQWDFTEPEVLRWRARNASDPAFDNTTITYVLHYSLSNVLQRDDDRYVLDHNFAFEKREGVIEHFQLDLTLDPAWQTSGPLQKTWTVERIPVGESFVLTVPLRFTGEGAPQADSGLSKEVRQMLLALLVIPLLLFGYALVRERMLGRLAPPPADITRAWLEQNLLRERPEVIGAMWDLQVGAAEVSATLARLVAEGRIESKVVGESLDLTIVSRKDLNEYEQALIDGLFFRGNHTSTSMIQAHYADSGFNPAEKLAPGLMKVMQERLPQGTVVDPWPFVAKGFFYLTLVAFASTVFRHSEFLVHSILIFLGGAFVGFLAREAGAHWRSRKLLGLRHAFYSMIPAALAVGVVAYVVWRSSAIGVPEMPIEMQYALTSLALWIFASAVHAMRSRESREAIAFMKMLGTAREYFKRELQKERPALDDAWYPYVLAFGLNDDVERWYRAFPGVATDDRWTSSSHSSSSSSSSSSSTSMSPSTWTGGGGAFGGAGASGMWAAAATGMAAGVAAPSSSSSDSGGSSSSSSSSSGGSSGGGGGGGW